MGFVVLGRERKQSQGEVLQAHRCGSKTADGRDRALAADCESHRPHPGTCEIGTGVPPWAYADFFVGAGSSRSWQRKSNPTSLTKPTTIWLAACRAKKRGARPISSLAIHSACSNNNGNGIRLDCSIISAAISGRQGELCFVMPDSL